LGVTEKTNNSTSQINEMKRRVQRENAGYLLMEVIGAKNLPIADANGSAGKCHQYRPLTISDRPFLCH